MTDGVREQAAWLRNTLGIETEADGPPPPGAVLGKNPIKAIIDEVGALFSRFKKKKAPPIQPTQSSTTTVKDEAFEAKLRTLKDEIGKVDLLGCDTAQMQADADDLATRAETVSSEQDENKRDNAYTALRKRADQMIQHVRGLQKSIKDVMGDAEGPPSAQQKNDAYKKALEDFYGLTITVPNGMTNTHFDQMFDMFGTVPQDHVKQNKLKALKYDTNDIGGVYYSTPCEIEMGNFGDGTRMETHESSRYILDGEVVPANSFNVTALHEIGHALDAHKNIMVNNKTKDGAGGWTNWIRTDAVVPIYANALKQEASPSSNVTETAMLDLVRTAIVSGTVTQPNDMSNEDWQKINAFLVTKCLPARDAAQPYFSNNPAAIGDMVYVEGAPGWWCGYKSAARGSTYVNNYQWRSPPEWFAEVYAITWLAKKKPPTGVAAEIAEYCWNG